MAEAVFFDLAHGILNALDFVCEEEFGLLPGVKGKLVNLRNTVSAIKDVLRDAEARYTESSETKHRFQKLGDVLYEADDFVDDLATEALRLKVMSQNNKVRHFIFNLSCRRKMHHSGKKIHEGLIEFPLSNYNPSPGPMIREEEPFTVIPLEDARGRVKEKEEIIDVLLDLNVKDNISVIPIVGIAGMGKTTLAQVVYNEDKVQKHFHLKMWVCVHQDFEFKRIVKEIVESAIPEGLEDLATESLSERLEDLETESLSIRLRTEINAKRFLLVLDDVRNEDHEKWSNLKSVLACAAKGSKIVITTRSNVVANIMSTVPLFVLKPLSFEDSWALFRNIVFQGQVREDAAHVDIGQVIIKKCGGVPFLIRAIGKLLCSMKSEEDWSKFRDDKLPNILQENDRISSVLRLSYDNLPSHLKNCFAYCALFPKDHEINVQVLIKLWMGQGLLHPSDADQSPESVGYNYFLELVERSFFPEEKKDEWGIRRSFKMQNLMHDLAILVAGVVTTMLKSSEENIDERTRHVSFNFSLDSSWKYVSQFHVAKSVRSFLLPSQSRLPTEEKFSKSSCNLIFSRFKRLRVLDLHDLAIKVVPTSVCKLKHLRYLDLSKNGIKMLPSSITRLQNLQTLKLSNCDMLEELPKDIKNLIKLRHLEIDGCDKLTRMPRGLGHLTDLQTLSLFVLRKNHGAVCRHSAKLSELKMLNNLRGGLEILHLEQLADATSETKNAKLKKKQHLQFLTLRWYRQDYHDADVNNEEKSLKRLQPHEYLKVLCVIGYGGRKFPSWLSSFTHLVKFTLCNCPNFQRLPPLDQLYSLKILKLQRLHSLEYITHSCGEDEDRDEEDEDSDGEDFVRDGKDEDSGGEDFVRDGDDEDSNGRDSNSYGLPTLSSDQLSMKSLLPHGFGEDEDRDEEDEDRDGEDFVRDGKDEDSGGEDFVRGGECFIRDGEDEDRDEEDEDSNGEDSVRDGKDEDSGGEDFVRDGKDEDSSGEDEDRDEEDKDSDGEDFVRDGKVEDSGGKDFVRDEDSSGEDEDRDEEDEDSDGEDFITDEDSRASTKTFFRSLKELILWDCPKLQRWHYDHNIVVSFSSLSKFEVQYCPKLTSMPLYRRLNKQLVLRNATMELLQQTMQMADNSSSVPSYLESLTLSGIEELESLQEKWLQNLTSLEHLNISECRSLTSLSQGIQNLTKLEYLDIRDCEKLDLSTDDGDSNTWAGLASLRSLTLWGLPKLESLPEGLKQVRSLENIRILNCPNLIALPDWISSFTSLSRLVISKCGKLALLPEGISSLTSLRRLVIDDCPMLLQRCRGEHAEDSYKIKHIPDFSERLTSWDFD